MITDIKDMFAAAAEANGIGLLNGLESASNFWAEENQHKNNDLRERGYPISS